MEGDVAVFDFTKLRLPRAVTAYGTVTWKTDAALEVAERLVQNVQTMMMQMGYTAGNMGLMGMPGSTSAMGMMGMPKSGTTAPARQCLSVAVQSYLALPPPFPRRGASASSAQTTTPGATPNGTTASDGPFSVVLVLRSVYGHPSGAGLQATVLLRFGLPSKHPKGLELTVGRSVTAFPHEGLIG